MLAGTESDDKCSDDEGVDVRGARDGRGPNVMIDPMYGQG